MYLYKDTKLAHDVSRYYRGYNPTYDDPSSMNTDPRDIYLHSGSRWISSMYTKGSVLFCSKLDHDKARPRLSGGDCHG